MSATIEGPPAHAAEGPSLCLVCGVKVWRVPCGRYDWMWVDEQSRAMARKDSFRYRYTAEGERIDWLVDDNPYRRLRELRALPRQEWSQAEVMEYTALRRRAMRA